ncbi:MAG: response regulator transcription factor [Flavobacteriales bacterium]
MQKICLVEDEKSIGEIVKLNLELEGYSVEWLVDGEDAKKLFEANFEFDLIILDVMLPHINGVDLCRIIRFKSKVPVLFLSAKGKTTDRIQGLKVGGNDYLPKPFDLEELLLRVSVLIGDASQTDIEQATIGEYLVNFKTYDYVHLLTQEKKRLSKKEIALLQLFLEKEGEVISRNELLDRLWGKNQFPTTRTIDNYILNFRKIFELDSKNPKLFHSIRGVGYKFTP